MAKDSNNMYRQCKRNFKALYCVGEKLLPYGARNYCKRILIVLTTPYKLLFQHKHRCTTYVTDCIVMDESKTIPIITNVTKIYHINNLHYFIYITNRICFDNFSIDKTRHEPETSKIIPVSR